VLLRNLGELNTIQDRYTEALACFEATLTGARQLGERHYEAAALSGLAFVQRLLGQYDAAIASFTAAATLCERIGNTIGRVYAQQGIGVVHRERGEIDEARRLAVRSLATCVDAGYRPGEAAALRTFGLLATDTGDLDAAAAYFTRAATVAQELGDRLAVAYAHQWLADVYLRRKGQEEFGIGLLHACLAVFADFGDGFCKAAALHTLARGLLATGRPGEARGHLDRALRIWRRLRSPYWLAEALDVDVALRTAEGDVAGATVAASEARAARSSVGLPAHATRPVPAGLAQST
jgi:tetratricopeptide (TPR) repeat protein